MSVYIKGMEMPTSCDKCAFCDGEAWCIIPGDWRLRYNVVPGEILSACPLVPVPDHGDLIDRDVLNDMINRSYPMTDRVDVHNGYAICQEMIKQLPTIIEAEDG